MRWKREHWDQIEAFALKLSAELGTTVNPIDIVRHATLRAVGALTNADQLHRVALALNASLAAAPSLEQDAVA